MRGTLSYLIAVGVLSALLPLTARSQEKAASDEVAVLLEDDFSGLAPGMFSVDVEIDDVLQYAVVALQNEVELAEVAELQPVFDFLTQ